MRQVIFKCATFPTQSFTNINTRLRIKSYICIHARIISPILRYEAQIGVPAAAQKTISWNTLTSIRMEAGYIGPTLCQKVSGDLLTC